MTRAHSTQHEMTHLEQAMCDPADLYATPDALLKDTNLTRKEKLRVLENWRDETKHLLESIAENMCADEGSACEEELLQEICRMIDVLKHE